MIRVGSYLSILAIALVTFTSAGCQQEPDIKRVSLAPTSDDLQNATKGQEKLRFAIGAVISPERTYSTYYEFVRYIGERLGQPYEMVQRKTYAEINELLYMKNVQAGLICTGAYVDGHEKFGLKALAVPVCYGEPVYYSYIIVPNDSLVENFEQLRGKRFAFTDPLSNTGYYYPMYLLAVRDETPDSFFGSYIFTYSHDNSIQAVAEGLVDAAAVDHLVYLYDFSTNPELEERIKVIHESPAFYINPIVVPADTDAAYERKLKAILLGMHEVPEGKEILEKLKIERFVEASDSRYDFVREMRKTVQGAKPGHAEVMKIFQKEVGEIIDGLATDNMRKVEIAGHALHGLYYESSVDVDNIGLDKKAYEAHKEEFMSLDRKFHSLAEDISRNAKSGDKENLLGNFSQILATCVHCHDKFRVKDAAG